MSKSSGKIKVLIIDDSAYNRKMIGSMVMKMDEVESAMVASDGEEAIKNIMSDPPDVITLDLNMPRMDGFTFLRWLMKHNPLPVVVVSAEGSEKNVFKALDLGALDFVVKPVRYASELIAGIESELQQKIRAVSSMDIRRYTKRLGKGPSKAGKISGPASAIRKETEGVVVIGASTGGPSAVQKVLADLRKDFPLSIVVVQHMPPVFTEQFAKRLGKHTPFEAKEAEDGDVLYPGCVYVAPGGKHLEISETDHGRLSLKAKESSDRYVPSVDVTMTSAAAGFGKRAVGVLLTGMGNDGAEGMLRILGSGGTTIAESEKTAVIFGMPRAAIRNKAASLVLELDKIPDMLSQVAFNNSGLKNARGGDN